MRARRVDDDGVDWIYWIVLIARIVVDNGRLPANSLYFISLIILSGYDKIVIFINLFVQSRRLDRFVSTGAVSDRVTDRRTGRKVNNNSRSMSPSYKTRGVVPKSASFHGRIPLTSSTSEEYRQTMIRRPKTHPELLRNSKLSSSSSSTTASKSRLPAKVPVNVTLRSSMWAVQVMASTEWKVEDLISASLRQYIKEGRKPLLPPSSIDPSFYNLHYSQYSFQSEYHHRCLPPHRLISKVLLIIHDNRILCYI